MKIRVAIADDHLMFRQGIAALFLNSPDMEIIAEAADGEEALVMVETHKPDVLLLDIEMPKKDGIEVLKELQKKKQPTKVLVLTMFKSAQFVKNIIKGGAAGYLKKDVGRDILFEAIQKVHTEGHYFTSEAQALLVQGFSQPQPSAKISPREKEVITLIVDGLTTKEIAAKLFLSKYTIESHRQNVMLKLDVKNTAELVKYVLQHNLV